MEEPLPRRALTPFATERFGAVEARHLLCRAGFGGMIAEVEELAEAGLDAAVDSLVEFDRIPTTPVRPDMFDKDIVRPGNAEERREVQRARQGGDESVLERFRMQIQMRQRADRQQIGSIQEWWLQRILSTPRPLEEKMTLFWHGHFATNYRGTEDSYHMFLQNQLFRRHALGNFADLCFGIIRDPAMLRFLNNDRNRRQAPNENFARELMELFTLGEGNIYTERDIKEAARALTGYTFDDDEFVFRREWHDTASKRFMGQMGVFDGDDIVRIILSKAVVAQFICMKLYRYFVNDAVTLSREAQAVIREMAAELTRSKGELRPVLKAVFRSQHFYETRHLGGMIKSPVQVLAEAVRTLGLPVTNVRPLVAALAAMGQNLFFPPSVKGWEIGRSWINTSTLFARQNVFLMLLRDRADGSGEEPRRPGTARAQSFSAMALVQGVSNDAIDSATRLLRIMLPLPPTADQVRRVVQLFEHRGVNEQSVRGAILLIAAMPEYQLS